MVRNQNISAISRNNSEGFMSAFWFSRIGRYFGMRNRAVIVTNISMLISSSFVSPIIWWMSLMFYFENFVISNSLFRFFFEGLRIKGSFWWVSTLSFSVPVADFSNLFFEIWEIEDSSSSTTVVYSTELLEYSGLLCAF